MNGPLKLRLREHEITTALTLKLRLLSQRQVAERWYDGDVPNARRCLKRLQAQDLVCRHMVPAQPIPEVVEPLVTWKPRQPAPHFPSVAQRCQARWRGRALRPCVVWTATDTAAALFGGPHRRSRPNPLQATHDLGVAAVWLHLRRTAPPWADAWRGEDLLAYTRFEEKRPDAFVVNSDEQVVMVIEYGGRYDADRIADFHRDCAARDLPYQLW